MLGLCTVSYPYRYYRNYPHISTSWISCIAYKDVYKRQDEDMNNLRVSLLETSDFQQIESSGDSDYTIDYYPFEIMETTFTAKHVGNIKAGNVKSVSLSARVRRDAGQGYYSCLLYTSRCV